MFVNISVVIFIDYLINTKMIFINMNLKRIIKEELSNRELYRSRKILSNPYEGLRFKSIHNDDVEYYTIIDVVDNDDEPTHLKISNSLDRTHSRIEYNEWMDRVRVNDFIAVDVERDRPLRESVDRNKVEEVVNDVLSKSIIRLWEPDSHYVKVDRHEIVVPGKRGKTLAKVLERDYDVYDWEIRNEIVNTLDRFMYMLNEKYYFVLTDRLPYFDYPITLLDVKKHIEEL